jgi:CRP-like cAMP-binding protein
MADMEQVLHFFANARFLRLLDEAGRRRLLADAAALTFQDGETVVREGDPGDALYIIVDGVAAVEADDMGTARAVAELTDGAFFGEIGVITDQPRSATVRARGRLQVLRIPKARVLEVLQDYPRVREMMAKVGVARTEDTMEKMSLAGDLSLNGEGVIADSDEPQADGEED